MKIEIELTEKQIEKFLCRAEHTCFERTLQVCDCGKCNDLDCCHCELCGECDSLIIQVCKLVRETKLESKNG